MSGMSGASMLRTRRKDVNVKPNRKLDRKSSRGMLYENEELRLRTININAEVERGQSDIKKLKRENDQLKREISALRYEYDRLDHMLRERSPEHSDDSASLCSACPDCVISDAGAPRTHVAFNDLSVVPEEEHTDGAKSPSGRPCSCEECSSDVQSSVINHDPSSRNNHAESMPIAKKQVDVLIHDAPDAPAFFEAIASPEYRVTDPPPPGSAPVGENDEPIYATVNKLPKRLRRMELANLENEVAYRAAEQDSSRTEVTVKTDSDLSQVPPADDETSRSEKEKPSAKRPDSPKAKKRKRFSFTFKKRERKRRDKKKDVQKNGSAPTGPAGVESDNERLLELPSEEVRARHCQRHRARHAASSCSSGPRYKRDSYQEMTTSHSEHERTNSVSSSVNSTGSTFTPKARKFSAPPQDGSIPWCGCWGAGCI